LFLRILRTFLLVEVRSKLSFFLPSKTTRVVVSCFTDILFPQF